MLNVSSCIQKCAETSSLLLALWHKIEEKKNESVSAHRTLEIYQKYRCVKVKGEGGERLRNVMLKRIFCFKLKGDFTFLFGEMGRLEEFGGNYSTTDPEKLIKFIQTCRESRNLTTF